jgi:hypothetical protein
LTPELAGLEKFHCIYTLMLKSNARPEKFIMDEKGEEEMNSNNLIFF